MIFLDKHRIKEFIININSTIKNAIENLQKSKAQICLVIDKNRLKGTVTDGDIRRGILRGLNITDKISLIMNKKPIVCKNDNLKKNILNLMKINQVLQIPIIDHARKITGMYFLNNFLLKKKFNNPIIILAGGKGKRVMPYTKNIPKPMLEVYGKPILEHIINNLKSQGFNNILISVNYKKEKIIKFLKNGKDLGVNIRYINEKKVMGTSGCLSLIDKSKISTKEIILLNGDIISSLNISEMLEYHRQNKATATMASLEFQMENPYGVIKTNDEKIIGFEEKPINKTSINAGIYIIDKKNLKYVPKKKFDITDLFTLLLKKKKNIIIYPIYEKWIEIGNKGIYEQIIKNKKT